LLLNTKKKESDFMPSVLVSLFLNDIDFILYAQDPETKKMINEKLREHLRKEIAKLKE
jgi:hypothetical protein